MQFDTFTFLVFFAVVTVLYYAISSWSARKYLLLAASYLFYSAWNPLFLFLILFSTVVDWFIARGIAASAQAGRRKFLLLMSLCANLGLLAIFKYAGFFLDVFADLCQLFGLQYRPPDWGIILPVGISFYTFQTLSYTIDVYRGHFRPAEKFSDYALYVGFFPQLVAGPIVRARHFLPQCRELKPFNIDQLGYGLLLMGTGLFAKVVLSDTYLLPFVDIAYNNVDRIGSFEAWLAVFAFSGQIFFDFSGYSLIAIGAALTLGFVLPRNFDRPYGAIGFSDFWRRWHISLSSWLRDYLYIPLGGNRQAHYKMYLALFATMLLGGLWHGAAWGFIVWGMLHGSYLMIERFLRDHISLTLRENAYARLITAMLTFFIVSLTWIFFRAPNFTVASSMFERLFVDQLSDLNINGVALGPLSVVFIMSGLLFYHIFARTHSYAALARVSPWWAKGAYLAFLFLGLTLLSSGDKSAFIYFQF